MKPHGARQFPPRERGSKVAGPFHVWEVERQGGDVLPWAAMAWKGEGSGGSLRHRKSALTWLQVVASTGKGMNTTSNFFQPS